MPPFCKVRAPDARQYRPPRLRHPARHPARGAVDLPLATGPRGPVAAAVRSAVAVRGHQE
ncbi:hypothetical protein KNE206_19030 [Kitasatospora sp. NE20-6]|uniref:hypothetical protein n=1 Tax=Kitasatospora sp. NE20-6 TaxID=2859066 RepID=UPI0034DC5C30